MAGVILGLHDSMQSYCLQNVIGHYTKIARNLAIFCRLSGISHFVIATLWLSCRESRDQQCAHAVREFTTVQSMEVGPRLVRLCMLALLRGLQRSNDRMPSRKCSLK